MVQQGDVDHQNKCSEVSIAKGDPLEISKAYETLGDQYEKAVDHSLEIGSKTENPLAMETMNSELSMDYPGIENMERVVKYLKRSLEVSTSIGDKSGIALMNVYLGNAYLRFGQYRKAIEYYEKGLEISTTIGDMLGIASNNVNLGNAYCCLGEYVKAIKYCEKSLEISTDIGDQSRIASNNVNLGNAYLCSGQYEKAIKYYEKCLEISSAIGDQSVVAASNGYLGNAYHCLGQYEKAIQYHEKHLERSTAIGDQSGVARSNANLGNAYNSLGQNNEAIEYHEKSLEISATIADQLAVARSNENLGDAYRYLGEYQMAIEYYKKCSKFSTAIGDMSGIASSNLSLGIVCCYLDRCEKAIEYYEKGLEISSAIGDKSGMASNNGNLGTAYLILRQYPNAIEYYEKGLEINTAIGHKTGIAINNGNLGNAYLSLEQYGKAIEYYEKGLEISTAIGDMAGIVSNYANLGNAYHCLGEYRKGIKYYEKGLEISTAMGNQLGVASSNRSLGNAYRCLEEHEKAIFYYEKSLELSTAIRDQSGIASNNGNLGNAYFSLGQCDKAAEYYEKSLKISNGMADKSRRANKYANLYYLYHGFVEMYVKIVDSKNETCQQYNCENVPIMNSSCFQDNSILNESIKGISNEDCLKRTTEGKRQERYQYECASSQNLESSNDEFRKKYGGIELKTSNFEAPFIGRQRNTMKRTVPCYDSGMVGTQIELSTFESENLLKENRYLRQKVESLEKKNGEIMAHLGQLIFEQTAKESEGKKAAIFQKIYRPSLSIDKQSDNDKVSETAKPVRVNTNQNGISQVASEVLVQGARVMANGIIDERKQNPPVRKDVSNNKDSSNVESLRNISEPQRHRMRINSEASGGERVDEERNVLAAVVSASSDRSQNAEQRLTRQTSERLSFSVQQDYSNESEYISLGNVPSTSAPTSALTTVCYNYKLLILSLGQVLLAEDVTKLKEWAAQSFSIENAQNATHILLQLDEKGIINASNLRPLRHFLETIVRIDLVHVIDAFLLGDYKLLRSIPAFKIRPQSSQYGALLGGSSNIQPVARYGTGNTTYLQSMLSERSRENGNARHTSAPSWSSTARAAAYTSRSPNENQCTDDTLANPKTIASACTKTSVVVTNGMKTSKFLISAVKRLFNDS